MYKVGGKYLLYTALIWSTKNFALQIWASKYKALHSACDVLVVLKSIVLPLYSYPQAPRKHYVKFYM